MSKQEKSTLEQAGEKIQEQYDVAKEKIQQVGEKIKEQYDVAREKIWGENKDKTWEEYITDEFSKLGTEINNKVDEMKKGESQESKQDLDKLKEFGTKLQKPEDKSMKDHFNELWNLGKKRSNESGEQTKKTWNEITNKFSEMWKGTSIKSTSTTE